MDVRRAVVNGECACEESIRHFFGPVIGRGAILNGDVVTEGGDAVPFVGDFAAAATENFEASAEMILEAQNKIAAGAVAGGEGFVGGDDGNQFGFWNRPEGFELVVIFGKGNVSAGFVFVANEPGHGLKAVNFAGVIELTVRGENPIELRGEILFVGFERGRFGRDQECLAGGNLRRFFGRQVVKDNPPVAGSAVLLANKLRIVPSAQSTWGVTRPGPFRTEGGEFDAHDWVLP